MAMLVQGCIGETSRDFSFTSSSKSWIDNPIYRLLRSRVWIQNQRMRGFTVYLTDLEQINEKREKIPKDINTIEGNWQTLGGGNVRGMNLKD